MIYIFLMVVMCSVYLEISFRNKEQVLCIQAKFDIYQTSVIHFGKFYTFKGRIFVHFSASYLSS